MNAIEMYLLVDRDVLFYYFFNFSMNYIILNGNHRVRNLSETG